MPARRLSCCLSLSLCLSPLSASEVVLRDYTLLSNGMSEAEVLYRLGPYDHETIYFDHWRAPVRKTWYYVPESRSGWITEIVFDAGGHVQSLERTRPYP